jgi:antitoxin component YwqK of YwqJK toxin-antitoxin module
MKMKYFFLLLCLSQWSFSQTEINKLDSNGNKHGLWKGVYEESKRPRYEGTFDHGKEIGVFNYFDDTKKKVIIATREFSAKDNSAYTIFYDQDKNKVSEGKVVNKLFEGKWVYYHLKSKKIMATENYIAGKLEGLRTVFFVDGKMAEQMTYANDAKEGVYKKYSDKGILLEQSHYKNNEYHGKALFYDDEGVLASQGLFELGKKEGIWQFYKNGKLIKERNMSFPEKGDKTKNK